MYRINKEKVYTVIRNGEKSQIIYDVLCHKLGFNPSARFVKITSRGTISFTVGKPDEIKALYNAVISAGYKPAKRLEECVKTL